MNCRIRGVSVRVDFIFLATLALVLIYDQSGMAACSLYAVAIHELSHLAVMCLLSVRPERISLTSAGIGICYDFPLLSYKKELMILLAGSAANLAVFFGFSFLQQTNPAVFAQLCLPHLAIGLFNLLPVSVLDGGRILRSVLGQLGCTPRTADTVCFSFSLAFLLTLTLLSLYLFFQSGYNFTMLATVLYLAAMMFHL